MITTDEKLLESLCEKLGVSVGDIQSTDRSRSVTLRRHVISWHLVTIERLGLSAAAKLVRKDHSTVSHSRKVVDDFLCIGDRETVRLVKLVKQVTYEN